MKKQSASGFRIAKHLRMMKKLLICNRKMPAVYHLLDNSVSSLIRMVTFAAVGGSTTRLSTSRPSFHTFYLQSIPSQIWLFKMPITTSYTRVSMQPLRQSVRNFGCLQFVNLSRVLRCCVTCRKVVGKPYPAPDPAPLPKSRIHELVPFRVTGVDFTGALFVDDVRGFETKVYICLFTCATSRVIHLEVVTDLTEETFIQAFRRFASRK